MLERLIAQTISQSPDLGLWLIETARRGVVYAPPSSIVLGADISLLDIQDLRGWGFIPDQYEVLVGPGLDGQLSIWVR